MYHTPEVASLEDRENLDQARAELSGFQPFEKSAKKSWYKTEQSGIPVQLENASRSIIPLSEYSSIVASIKPSSQTLLYVKQEHAEEARRRVKHIGLKEETK